MSEPEDLGRPRVDLAELYAELQNLLVEHPDVDSFLQQAAVLAAAVVPGSSCGVTMRRAHEVSTVATSDAFAARIDELQYGRGQGPCLQALRSGAVVLVTDLVTEDRWPAYRMHALTHGVRSSLSMPLLVDGESRGAVNLYAMEPDSFDDDAIGRCRSFARGAGTALTLVLRSTDAAAMQDQLRQALTTRAVVDQAIGIVMGQQRVAATDAFAVLREASQARNRKLRDIAADLIESVTGEPPRPPRPFTDPR